MTVCIAALCQWNYGTRDKQNAATIAVVLTDRMITAGDVQYEPQQTKHAHVTPKVLLVIAGDYSLHSQAIRKSTVHFRGAANATPEEVATYYGRAIQALKLKEAEDLYLAPLGLNSDSFVVQQKDMAGHFVTHLTEQMQAYRGEELDALVIGPQDGAVSIYGVDTKGMITCHDDVGFAAIGSGAWHAKSRLMQFGYVNSSPFVTALVVSYAARKVSEVAPGVGQNTDIKLVFREHVEELRPDVGNRLHELFIEYSNKANQLGIACIDSMYQYVSKPVVQDADEPPKGIPGGSAQINERTPAPAAETPRSDERVEKETDQA